MSSDNPSARNKSARSPIQRAALEIVRREMHLYDRLASKPRLRYERAVVHTLDSIADAQHGTRSCAHGRALHDVCAECGRDENDCKAYRVAAQQRIKDLLKQLGE